MTEKKQEYRANSADAKAGSIVMYLDMNSYFASCEQQLNPALRGKPVGVITYDSPNACIIAPSIEAKKYGVKTGMRLTEGRQLCPQIIPVTTQPFQYRRIHVAIMDILRSYCDDVIAKSIDEAMMNMTSYRLVYKDMQELGRKIKADITKEYDWLKCSIGIAPNSFLAKLATEMQKPDGLVEITRENIDEKLSRLQLQDLPGIASRNERRLKLCGIDTPLQMRHTSEALLRKAFGGVVGNFWHRRLNFGEVDMYSHENRNMSAMRTVSRQQRENKETLEAMLVALCTKLEQRMVKQDIFCRSAGFFIKYRNHTGWDTKIRFEHPVQDGLELRHYLLDRIRDFERGRNTTMFNKETQSMGVVIGNFMMGGTVQYSLFDNRMKQDKVRKTMYNIKDKYGRNIVRKGVEMLDPYVMKDAIGFGSVRDMGNGIDGEIVNKYMLEEDF
jgi:DNA polymerase-4